MDTFTTAVTIVSGVSVIGGFLILIVKTIYKFADGQKCLLRQAMLEIYYKYKDEKVMPEYDARSFYHCLESYRALGGNSFINDIAKEVDQWTVSR